MMEHKTPCASVCRGGRATCTRQEHVHLFKSNDTKQKQEALQFNLYMYLYWNISQNTSLKKIN